MTRIEVYNIQECGHNHVAVVEEQEHGYRVSFAGLPYNYVTLSNVNASSIVLPFTAARSTRDAALMVGIQLREPSMR